MATPKTKPGGQRKSLLGFASASTKLRTQSKSTPLEKRTLTYSAAKPPPSASSRRWSTQGATPRVKDNRPLSNKGYQRSMVDSICEFLGNSGYPYSVNVKILSSPTTKEFLRIFEHLYKFILPNFSLDQKNYRTEIPELLKNVRFPFHISKTTMSGIGSMHAWPTLLGSLHWLVELIQTTDNIDIDSVLVPMQDDPHVAHRSLFFIHSTKMYHAFMNGQDEFGEENSLLEKAVLHKEGLSEEDNLALQQDVINMENELRDLENEPDMLEEAMKHKEELQDHFDKLKQAIDEEDQESGLLSEQHATYVSQLREEHEGFNVANLGDTQIQEELKRRYTELEKQLDQLTLEKEHHEQQNDKLEVSYSRTYDRCSSIVNEYNDIARSLAPNHLIRTYVGEQSLLLQLDHSTNNLTDFKQRLKPLLVQLSHKLNEVKQKLQLEKIGIEHESDKLQESISMLENVECVQGEERLKNVEKELTTATDEHDRKIKEKKDELRIKEEQLDKKHKEMCDVTEEEKSKLATLRNECEHMKTQHAQDEDRAVEQLLNYADLVAKAKQSMEEKIDQFNDALRKQIKSVETEYTLQYSDYSSRGSPI